MYNVLRVWRLMSWIGASLEHPDDPRGEAPMFAFNPMIMEVLIPLQRANTRDPEVRNPAFKGGEGSLEGSHYIEKKSSADTRHLYEINI